MSVSPSGQVYKPFWGEKFTVIRDAEFVEVTDAVDNTTEGSSAHGYVVRVLPGSSVKVLSLLYAYCKLASCSACMKEVQ